MPVNQLDVLTDPVPADDHGHTNFTLNPRVPRCVWILRLGFPHQIGGLYVAANSDPTRRTRSEWRDTRSFLCGHKILDQRHGTLDVSVVGCESARSRGKLAREIEHGLIDRVQAAHALGKVWKSC